MFSPVFMCRNAVESLVQEKEAIAEKLKEENRKALEQLRERLEAENMQSKKVSLLDLTVTVLTA